MRRCIYVCLPSLSRAAVPPRSANTKAVDFSGSKRRRLPSLAAEVNGTFGPRSQRRSNHFYAPEVARPAAWRDAPQPQRRPSANGEKQLGTCFASPCAPMKEIVD